MTFLENKLIEIFRACSDDQRFKILELANLISTFPDPQPSASSDPDPDPAPVQTSTPDPEIDRAGQRMLATAQKAEVPKLYQMVLGELCYLHDLTLKDGNEFAAICLAFDYGFVKGNRAYRRGRVKAL